MKNTQGIFIQYPNPVTYSYFRFHIIWFWREGLKVLDGVWFIILWYRKVVSRIIGWFLDPYSHVVMKPPFSWKVFLRTSKSQEHLQHNFINWVTVYQFPWEEGSFKIMLRDFPGEFSFCTQGHRKLFGYSSSTPPAIWMQVCKSKFIVIERSFLFSTIFFDTNWRHLKNVILLEKSYSI